MPPAAVMLYEQEKTVMKRFGIVGAGIIAAEHKKALMKRSDCIIAAVCATPVSFCVDWKTAQKPSLRSLPLWKKNLRQNNLWWRNRRLSPVKAETWISGSS